MLNHYGLLKISGIDAKKLLQGQLTCDIEKLAPGKNCLGALCNPQGRIISLFKLFLLEDSFYLFMLKDLVPITLNALKKYAVFYKTQLSDESDQLKTLLPEATWFTIEQKIPHIYPETSGKFLPHELNLDQAGAIDFDKGCYTGQEIIARMHYRGKLKKHLVLVELNSPNPPAPGSDYKSGILVDAQQKAYNIYDALVILEE